MEDNTVKITFNIDPVAWQRPRFNGSRGFTAASVRKFENTISVLAKSHFKNPPLDCPLRVSIAFHIAPPKTTKNKLPRVRPDIDNYIKGVLDSLNGILWIDDGQICELVASKYYEWSTGKGRIDIEVTPLGDKK